MARRKTDPANADKQHGNPDKEGIPSFDEKALSALTARIDKGFGGGGFQQAGDGIRARTGSKGIENQRPVKAQSKTKPAEVARGTKRDIRGNAKGAGGELPSVNSKQRNGKGIDDRATLLKEILALGGTEEDLDLVADAVSDEEDNNLALPDKSFQKELANFVAGLGIEGEIDEVGGDDSDKEDVADAWEDASDVNSSSGFDDGKDVVESLTTPLHKNLSEDPKRLVSTISRE
jgi:ribosome biogenesis protein MAK21